MIPIHNQTRSSAPHAVFSMGFMPMERNWTLILTLFLVPLVSFTALSVAAFAWWMLG